MSNDGGEEPGGERGAIAPSSDSGPPLRSDGEAYGRDPHQAERLPSPARPLRPLDKPPGVPAADRGSEQVAADDNSDKRWYRRRPVLLAFGLAVMILVGAAGYLYLDNVRHFETTNDAFIAARQFPIASQVSGYITAVPVTDNQHVAAGDVIAQIDDRYYRAALDQAKYQLARDQSVLAQAQRNLARDLILRKTETINQKQIDDETSVVEQDKDTVALDQAKVDSAQLDLSHTTVAAAQPGHVVQLSAGVGQYVSAGTALSMFVPDEIWVTANFKETQLDSMRPGQPVTIRIDAYPKRTVRGHIASVQPGSGTAFSLLPAENATGNYVKIVQRVPVKITMDNPPTDITLGPGMSLEATVRTDPTPSLYERLKRWL